VVSGSSASSSSNTSGMSTIALAKNSRLEAVAKARELARQQQKEKLQVREAQQQHTQQHTQQQHHVEPERHEDTTHYDREEDDIEDDHHVEHLNEVEKVGRSSSVGEEEDQYSYHTADDSGGHVRVVDGEAGGGSTESCDDVIPELEDALRLEEEEIRAAERIRHMQIEQARAQQRATGGPAMTQAERDLQLAKAKKLKKKKKPTFWDTLFMCGSEAEATR